MGDGVTPHVAQKAKGLAIDGRTSRHIGYRTSLTIRKRIDEVFGCIKPVLMIVVEGTIGDLCETKLCCLKRAWK